MRCRKTANDFTENQHNNKAGFESNGIVFDQTTRRGFLDAPPYKHCRDTL